MEEIVVVVIVGGVGKCIRRGDIMRLGEGKVKGLGCLGILLEGVGCEGRVWGILKDIDDEGMCEGMCEFRWGLDDEVVGVGGGMMWIEGKGMRGRVVEKGGKGEIVWGYWVEGGVRVGREMWEEKGNEISWVGRVLKKVEV